MPIKIVSVGVCPNCHKEHVRPYPCDAAICTCKSTQVVPLELGLILPTRMYNKFQKIANRAGVSLELLVNKVLEFGVEKLKGMNVKEVMQIG